MQWSLFLFILMGQTCFFSCQLYVYYFVEKSMNWYDAQTYCRQMYTDLATVPDMVDMKMLSNQLKLTTEVWIGLHNQPDGEDDRKWHWSLPGVEYIENQEKWHDAGGKNGNEDYCVLMVDHKWKAVSCADTHTFICYDDKNSSNKFYFVNSAKKWHEAQKYCREEHADLVSGLDQLEDNELTNKVNSLPKGEKYWIGLFADSWRWSDGSSFSFRHWNLSFYDVQDSKSKCAVISAGGWRNIKCDLMMSFLCYYDKVILITENMTWENALNHCQIYYGDLVSITDSRQQSWVEERAKKAKSNVVWLGLRYTCVLDLWFWVSDKLVCYENWALERKRDECDMSAAMEVGGKHKWLSKHETDMYSFICVAR